MKKRWKIAPSDKGIQEALCRELNVLPLTAGVLINRGLVEADKAFSFLRPELSGLHDPFLLGDMDKACGRIVSAFEREEKIAVYGDYDVDGVTAASCLYLFFHELGVEVAPYIPRRLSEGYGLNSEAIKKLHAEGVKLIITVDCGSSNNIEIAFANSLGVDVIITDHHEMGNLPPAFAVINPKRKDCAFPFKGLAGVGVAFNLMMALRVILRRQGWFETERCKNHEPNLKKYLDLVAIGTIADMVPLVDENRIFASCGLGELETTCRPGLIALKEAARVLPGRIDATTVAYRLAPRLNAAGRVGSASLAFALLTTQDAGEARSLADALNAENASRQRIEEGILHDALSMLGDGVIGKGIVLASEGWNAGVIGIVASRLVDRYCMPVVMIAIDKDNGVGRGSARGVKAFDLLSGLESCATQLVRFGGHKAAAGLTVRQENIGAFREEFMAHLNQVLPDSAIGHEIELDALTTLDSLDLRQAEEFGQLAPFGSCNPEPVLGAMDASILATEVVGAKHLRFRFKHNGNNIGGIGFGLADMHPMKGTGYSLAFSPYVDEWQGTRSLKLRIKDVRRFDGGRM
ncbi:MAG: single-stranded-DNA-specific exonuclease RecJ [Deltaproteobacteria bacterium]|nr:single-stranded-DNA-specific exonuclease RecJ [Deltaproteobacteria bacterium]